VNVLKPQHRTTIITLLENGRSQHEIHRDTGIHRSTIRRYERQWKRSKCPMATGSEGADIENVPPRPPDGGESKLNKIPKCAASECAPYREWIESQVVLGRNAQSIYQDLVERHAFKAKYNSVKRFVRGLKSREPERFDVLEFLPGEEAQVDYGQGALTLYKQDKYKRPYLFVMTLKFSGKSFRKVVWKTSQEVWAKLHEEAFRSFGGCPQFVVLDNLKEGVIKPDIYEPVLNRVYEACMSHYGVVAQPCRVRDPNRKGTVESAIQHTQSTALKGRKFETIEKQNEWLAHWEEKWAAPRIHGRKKRQVMEMYLEEKPHLKALPPEGFRYFVEEKRTVDDAGLVQVKGSYYGALPAALYSVVKVRIYENEIVVLDSDGLVLRRHERSKVKGAFKLEASDRIFNPSRETTKLIERIGKIGPRSEDFACKLFTELGRTGHGALYGLLSLVRDYQCSDIEAACGAVLDSGHVTYTSVKRILERKQSKTKKVDLKQSGPAIRPIDDYQTFWEINSQTNKEEEDGDVYH
jgi:transposase